MFLPMTPIEEVRGEDPKHTTGARELCSIEM